MLILSGLILILGGISTVCVADDIKAAEERARNRLAALKAANSKFGSAQKEDSRAREATAKAEAAFVAAHRALEAQKVAEASLVDADRMLTYEEKRIEELVKKWKVVPDDREHAGEKRARYRIIESYNVSLREAARKYLTARGNNARLIKEAAKAVRKAQDAFVAALRAQHEKEWSLVAVQQTKEQAQREAAEAMMALVKASLKDAPPYLREVLVEQEGKPVYHARWVPDKSIRILIYDLIYELEMQISDLTARLKEINKDSERNWKKISPAPKGVKLAGLPDTNKVLCRMAGDVQLELRDNLHESRSKHKPVRATWAYGIVARTFSKHGLLPRETSDFYLDYIHDDSVNVPKRIAEDLVDYQVDLLTKPKCRRRLGLVYPPWLDPKRKDAPKIYIPPHFEAVKLVLSSAENEIRMYVEWQCSNTDVARVVRKSLDEKLLVELAESFKRLREKTKAEDNYEIGPHASYLAFIYHIRLAINELAKDESDYIELLISSKRRYIEQLRAVVPDAATRRLEVLTNRPLRIGKDIEAKVLLTFSSILTDAPTVVLGESTPGGPTMGIFKGLGASWSCSLDTEKLLPVAEDKGGIRLHVAAKDPAGRALDADPITEAGKTGMGAWKNWEQFMHALGNGTGGVDTWHMLNLAADSGTSYCFVVDASGSMKEKNRLAVVKASAKAFVAKMQKPDEVALWVFFCCDNIQLLLPFTQDKDRLIKALEPVKPSQGTPLADAINKGGNYLVTRGKYRNKALVILTDGEETCRGNPHAAAARFREIVRVIGYGAGEPAKKPPTRTLPKERPKPPKEPPVKVQ
ncbi:MAG: VWA domain-containing protein, partial [Phycisphaerae bacterium]|nr:VWA domain-containing protein [Phycisphaerae bacterium]